MTVNPIADFEPITGVYHEQVDLQPVVVKPIDEYIVEDSTLLVGDERVADRAGRQRGDPSRQETVEKRHRLRPGKTQTPHVGDVEHSNCVARRRVLGND